MMVTSKNKNLRSGLHPDLQISFLRLKSLLFFFFAFVLFSCGEDGEPYDPSDNGQEPPPDEEVIAHERAKEIFDLINKHYKYTDSGLYRESYPSQSGDPYYSYLWPYDGLISGAAMLTKIGYQVNYTAMVDNFEKYYRQGANGNNIGGYGSSTDGTAGGGTRFYDDNSIVGLSLVEAYEITGLERFKERAKRIVPFLLSGEDQVLGGALWWNEDEKNITGNVNSNKPTCSNGYATLFLLKYYSICDEAEKADVLAFATRLYTWLTQNLRDPGDKCYWNDKNNQGQINYTKWTYNTGVMVQNGLYLYKITGNQAYLNEAIASAQGAYDYFVKPRSGLALAYPDHDPWFNTKLLRAYIDLKPYYSNAGSYIQTYLNFINNGYKKARTNEGFFFEDWTGTAAKRYYSLLMQVCVVESYGALSLYLNEKL
ncbi:MAG: glycoside hydrolase family 76 protein [Mangrovibacterium sp.]